MILTLCLLKVVISAMTAHLDSPSVQEEACWALYQFTGGGLPWARYQNMVSDRGGVTSALMAISEHERSPSLQAAVTALLGNLVFHHPPNQVTISELGGIDSVAIAALNYPDDVSVQSYASAFLLKMTMEGLNAPQERQFASNVISSGGARAILKGMHRHLDHCGIQVLTLTLILTLTLLVTLIA